MEQGPIDGRSADADPAERATGVLVGLGGARYAVDLAAVAEVVVVPAVTRVPGAPDWLAGVVNWRGRVLAVVDLRPLVGVVPAPVTRSARVVVLSSADVEAGLLVEEVSGLLDTTGTVAPVPPTVAPAVAALLDGTVDTGSGPVALVAAPAVLALGRQLRAGPRSHERATAQVAAAR